MDLDRTTACLTAKIVDKELLLKVHTSTSKYMDPLTPLTLIYDSVTLPIMCKCMYRKSSRKSHV